MRQSCTEFALHNFPPVLCPCVSPTHIIYTLTSLESKTPQFGSCKTSCNPCLPEILLYHFMRDVLCSLQRVRALASLAVLASMLTLPFPSLRYHCLRALPCLAYLLSAYRRTADRLALISFSMRLCTNRTGSQICSAPHDSLKGSQSGISCTGEMRCSAAVIASHDPWARYSKVNPTVSTRMTISKRSHSLW